MVLEAGIDPTAEELQPIGDVAGIFSSFGFGDPVRHVSSAVSVIWSTYLPTCSRPPFAACGFLKATQSVTSPLWTLATSQWCGASRVYAWASLRRTRWSQLHELQVLDSSFWSPGRGCGCWLRCYLGPHRQAAPHALSPLGFSIGQPRSCCCTWHLLRSWTTTEKWSGASLSCTTTIGVCFTTLTSQVRSEKFERLRRRAEQAARRNTTPTSRGAQWTKSCCMIMCTRFANVYFTRIKSAATTVNLLSEGSPELPWRKGPWIGHTAYASHHARSRNTQDQPTPAKEEHVATSSIPRLVASEVPP